MITPMKLIGNTYTLYDNEFDELIKTHYGISDYNFAVLSKSNGDDAQLYYNITKRFKYAFQEREYSDFLASTPDENTRVDLFLRDMVIRNILPPGNFIISVF